MLYFYDSRICFCSLLFHIYCLLYCSLRQIQKNKKIGWYSLEQIGINRLTALNKSSQYSCEVFSNSLGVNVSGVYHVANSFFQVCFFTSRLLNIQRSSCHSTKWHKDIDHSFGICLDFIISCRSSDTLHYIESEGKIGCNGDVRSNYSVRGRTSHRRWYFECCINRTIDIKKNVSTPFRLR